MTRSKKKKLKIPEVTSLPEEDAKKVPIDNLPENHLWMHVKNGTKIRNVLEYALKHFPERKSIVWTGAGQSINKTISCSQLFKAKHTGLHQVTRLRYVSSAKKTEESEATGKRTGGRVPEIHILLTDTPNHVNEPGYQGPDDTGEFVDSETGENEPGKASDPGSRYQRETPASSSTSGKITSLAAEEFAAMGLRTGQKRSRRDQQQQQSNATPVKKNKKKEPSSNGR